MEINKFTLVNTQLIISYIIIIGFASKPVILGISTFILIIFILLLSKKLTSKCFEWLYLTSCLIVIVGMFMFQCWQFYQIQSTQFFEHLPQISQTHLGGISFLLLFFSILALQI